MAWASRKAAAAAVVNARTKAADAAPKARQIGGDQPVSVPSDPGCRRPTAPQPQNFQAGAGQQQNGPPEAAKRWKKKFRDRDRQRPQENPGNVASGSNGGYSDNGGGYRDRDTHQPGNNAAASSARAAASSSSAAHAASSAPWTTAIAPSTATSPTLHLPPSMPSTATIRAAATVTAEPATKSDSQPIDYSQGRAIPIPADAPTKIFFFIEDLFFIAKIQETARKLGVKVAFVKNEKDAVAALTAGEEEDRPGLIVFDLNNANAKPLTLIPKLKAKLKRSTSIIGFLSHLQGDLKAKAVEAGCDTVMPRAAFSQNLPNLLRRYGIEEEEEQNYNQ